MFEGRCNLADNRKPIGAKESSPQVVKTEDVRSLIARFMEYENDKPQLLRMSEQLDGISYEVLRRIWRQENPATSLETVDRITTSLGRAHTLGNEIPIYRSPFMSDSHYFTSMEKALCRPEDPNSEWPEDPNPEWREYAESFPKM